MSGAPAGRASQPLPGADALHDARDRRGCSPGTWLARSLTGLDGPVLTLRSPAVGARDALVSSPGADAHPGRLPAPARSAGAVTLDMCLPWVPALDDLFGELRRVLRPAGTLVTLVPCRPGFAAVPWRSVYRAMGGRPGFRHESATGDLHWLIAAADFAVLLDQRRVFRLPVPDADAAARAVDALVHGGVWPSDLPPGRLAAAREALSGFAAPGRSLPVRLRLLVARR